MSGSGMDGGSNSADSPSHSAGGDSGAAPAADRSKASGGGEASESRSSAGDRAADSDRRPRDMGGGAADDPGGDEVEFASSRGLDAPLHKNYSEAEVEFASSRASDAARRDAGDIDAPQMTGDGPAADAKQAREGAMELHGAEDPREFRLEHSDEYLEPMSRARSVEQFQDPRTSVERINPDRDPEQVADDPYNVNCADCARCYEAAWRGREQEAAGRAYQIGEAGGLEVSGEASEQTEEWAHERFETTDARTLRASLERAGHGSSGIVHSTWEGPMPGGHAYNVVNYRGEVMTVEPQEGEVLDFSDEEIHPDLERASGVSHRAMAWDAKGERIL